MLSSLISHQLLSLFTLNALSVVHFLRVSQRQEDDDWTPHEEAGDTAARMTGARSCRCGLRLRSSSSTLLSRPDERRWSSERLLVRALQRSPHRVD